MYDELKKQLNDLYLSYVNDYLTVETMAEKEGFEPEDLLKLLEVGRKINRSK